MQRIWIQYGKKLFVDADKIEIIYRDDGELVFVIGSKDIVVEPEFESVFLNHAQAVNKGFTNIESVLRD